MGKKALTQEISQATGDKNVQVDIYQRLPLVCYAFKRCKVPTYTKRRWKWIVLAFQTFATKSTHGADRIRSPISPN